MAGIKDLSGFQLVHIDGHKPGGILREKRVVQKLTQQQVADKAKISLRQYQRFENNEKNICSASFNTACKVIEALGMDITKFYHGGYVFDEEIFLNDKGEICYKKTGLPVDQDVTEENNRE